MPWGAERVPETCIKREEPAGGASTGGRARRIHPVDQHLGQPVGAAAWAVEGYPVRLALNGRLLPETRLCAGWHSPMLVECNEDGFLLLRAVSESQRLSPGEKGIWVSQRTVSDAVADRSRTFSSPRHFALTVFETGVIERDLNSI